MRNVVLLLALVVLLLSSGCAQQKSWVYEPNKYNAVETTSEKTVVIPPFKDERINDNSNLIALYMIPLVPFGSANFEVPEGATMHIASALWINYKPTEDYPKALAEELKSAKLFKDSYFDYRTANSDFVVNGKIISTKYNGKIISYGLSVEGPLLWLIGFPAFSVTNELKLQMECVDIKSNKVILSKVYTAEPYSELGWIYSMPADFNYAAMLKNIYKEFIADLKKSELIQKN